MLIPRQPAGGLRDHGGSYDCAVDDFDGNTGYDGNDLYLTHGFPPGAGSQARTEQQRN